ncbi:MAG TPA: hypothetical protein VMU25_04485 [Candidatus Paceibacterota bacterium]|nr:hypothetical protein [Candidatus Paceibacterota bacterium]
MKNILTLVLALSFSFAPLAYAQDVPTDTSSSAPTVTDSAPATTDTNASTDTAAPAASPDIATTQDTSDPSSAPAPDPTTDANAPSDSSTADTSSTDVTVQDTTNTQTTVAGDTLEATANPQTSTSTIDTANIVTVDASSSDATSSPDSVVVAPDAATSTATSSPSDPSSDASSTSQTTDASSTPPTDTSSTQDVAIPADQSLDVVAQDVDQSPPQDATQTQQPTQKPIVIPKADLAPKPEYQFQISGTSVPVKEKDSAHASTLSANADNQTGVVNLSGSCSDTYYVVLLFKNKDDYANDPSSYILNKAYPCQGGSFSYAISDLPTSLENGTYYLLVGQEGAQGGWKPITDLTAITINRN